MALVYVTEQFIKAFNELDPEDKLQINSIVNDISVRNSREVPEYLARLYLGSGKAKWAGINKVLYHLYPQGRDSQHRLFYCFGGDLQPSTNKVDSDDVIFIAYVTRHDDERKAAKRYNKSTITLFYFFDYSFEKENDVVSTPVFKIKLTNLQNEILLLTKPPASIKGSAGTGKTLISYELFKNWIRQDNDSKFLYLTYTSKLINKAKDTLKFDGLDINKDNTHMFQFKDLFIQLEIDRQIKTDQIIDELNAREKIDDIINKFRNFNPSFKDDIIFSNYFVYTYIRGLMKGRVSEPKKIFNLNIKGLEMFLKDLNLEEEGFKIKKFLNDHLQKQLLEEKDLTDFLDRIVSSKKKKNIDSILSKFDKKTIDKINSFRLINKEFNFIEDSNVEKELKKDGISDKKILDLIKLKQEYNKILKTYNLYDDNDCAKAILNYEIENSQKYDGIVIDEVQDLTEIQIMAIAKLLKKGSNNIYFFGDPNQTINPTIYHFGRFNSYLYEDEEQNKRNINQIILKKTHRCGPNLLDYINHLVKLRKDFKLTTNTEDLIKEESERIGEFDGHFACLIEKKELIDFVLITLKDATDYYLIVDNEKSKEKVIEGIKALEGDSYDNNIENQIITVQNSKGLESESVVIFNLISDNIDIFNNLINETNNKVSSMTFNKFYVSVTRAKNSIIICEEGLGDHEQVKQILFYSGEKKIPEDIVESDIEEYLRTTNEPGKFFDQAIQLIEEKEYEKASRKNDTALRHLLNQFDTNDNLDKLKTEFKNSNLDEIQKLTSSISKENLEKYQHFFPTL
ncbi:MAG TPA: AAA family ATPase [Bacilli bacterium]|nr:AAA family ATPase [Bacilli bacterium]HOH17708.1 AAA family ATPase [Bacilli bacterium]